MVFWKLNIPMFSTLLVITITALSGALAQQCGSQAGGALCPGHLCCNQLGQCGDTSDFCQLPNCQSQCWSGQCGSQAGGALCPPGLCCSLWGWCGTTSDYCALPGCQSQCWASPSPPLPASPPPPPSSPPPPPASPPPPRASPPPPPASPPPPPASPPPPPASPPPPPASPPPPPASPPPPRASPPPPSASPPPPRASPPPPPASPPPPRASPPPPPASPAILPPELRPPALVPPPFIPIPSGGNISDIIARELFEDMFPFRNPFYTYDAFLTAASFFPGFGTTGDTATRKTEIAVFLAQTAYLTWEGWGSGPDPYVRGYYWIREVRPTGNYCVPDVRYPCVPGQSYVLRSSNYNYGLAGEAIGENLLSNPDLVATDAVVSFKTAIWFWMTEQLPKPSCNDVIIGNWMPSAADVAAGHLPGYGLITNIISGSLECGIGFTRGVNIRVGFFERFSDIFGIKYGGDLYCYTQVPFESSLLVDTM